MVPRPRRAASAAFAALAAASVAGSSSAGPAVTLYSRDLGYVRESRTFDLAGNRDTVRLENVSNRLDFSSVRLATSAARLLRLAFRWDVATGDGMIERSLGQRVRVVSRGERITEGVLLSADGAWLVVRTDDGGVSSLSRTAVEEVRLARPPATLTLRPALEAVFDSGRKGSATAELSYLTGGLSWAAEHTLVRTGETSGQWSAIVTLENTTGRDYVDADVKLIAGEPQRSTPEYPRPEMMMMRTMAADGGAPEAKMSEQAFADYHLYTLGRPATLRDRETQSVVMLDPRNVTLKPRYLYRAGDPRGVRSQVEMVNDAKSGAGAPLPAGRVRFYQADESKATQFTGETNIGHTPIDEKLTLEIGEAFDLKAERRELTNRRISDREREYSVEIKLRNRKAIDVTILVEEPAGGDVEIIKQTLASTRKDSGTLQWSAAVPAGKEVVITYTARQRW